MKADPYAYALHTVQLFTPVDDEVVPLTAVIRYPFENLDTHWLCAASISGLFHRKADLERDTPSAALKAARAFLIDELSDYEARGGMLLNVKQEPVTDLRALFPSQMFESAEEALSGLTRFE
ncbi:MAG: hypothetical protein AAF465_00750 [Pseudomonadota bacterium]